jgi:hypothetical protein
MAGGIGMALRDTGGNGLATAQTTLATMIGSARAQAAVNQTEAIVAIHALRPPGGDKDQFLRVLQVFRNDTPGAATPKWVPVGNPVTLPVGVFLVPPSTAGFLAPGVVWPANPPLLSNISGPTGLRQTAGTPFAGSVTAYTLQFNADGTVQELEQRNLGFVRFVVATAIPTATGPQFNNANAVRGLLVRRTGAVTLVNEPLAF